jgi:glycosyltransferase involved in cell wall biosynthesis
MICILHGYLLEGSGSNLWTREIVRSLCRAGEEVHLVCQENHPDLYEFIGRAVRYHPDGREEVFLDRETPYAGQCVMHVPVLGDTLPVYVWDRYEEFSRVVPMIELADEELEDYLETNVRVVERVVREMGITAIHANHAVLMSVVAERVGAATGVPYVVMPHGSAIEYAVRKDARFHRYASAALEHAARIVVIGEEMRGRVKEVFPSLPGRDEKLFDLNLGVDTSRFEPIPRSRRPDNIAALEESLQGARRGKTTVQSDELCGRLAGCETQAELREAIESCSNYDGKTPDADLEARLDSVDWQEERTLLFVGRLIASKGIHSVIAALPTILAAQPDTRLIVVGHGPMREPMEALLWALEHGNRTLAERIVAWGTALEGGPERPLVEVEARWDQLRDRGELETYFQCASRRVARDRVIFTGYLTHDQLRHLFPCCDAAVFPSVVAEAGPLVFLEALASGCFPLGTYFAGMAASIDSVSEVLPPEAAEWMRLSPEPEHTVRDIAAKVPPALDFDGNYRQKLREIAEERYDWRSVSGRLAAELESLRGVRAG